MKGVVYLIFNTFSVNIPHHEMECNLQLQGSILSWVTFHSLTPLLHDTSHDHYCDHVPRRPLPFSAEDFVNKWPMGRPVGHLSRQFFLYVSSPQTPMSRMCICRYAHAVVSDFSLTRYMHVVDILLKKLYSNYIVQGSQSFLNPC